MPLALVTGGTGQVGWHVIDRLRRDGWEVRALVRDVAAASALRQAGVTLVAGDTLQPLTLLQAARGCSVVFHAAAVITPRGGWETFSRPNVDGTRNIISAAESAGARLVHVSSVAVYGATERYTDGQGATTEDSPLAELPESAYYARSKRESEALVMAAHDAGRIWATAVRPCVIYGTHDRQFVPRVARLLRRGFAPLVGGGRTTLAVVNAVNVADGMVRAAGADVAGGRAYNLANDHAVSVADFFRLASMGMGVQLRTVAIPRALARAGVGLAGLVAPLFFGNQYRAALSASLDFVARDNPFNSDRARRELGWDPPERPEVGVVEAFRWWAGNH